MAKKLSLLLAAAAVLAFAVPAFANAATGLTQGGALVPVGKTIVGTNKAGTVVTTTSTKTGNIICKTVVAKAVLTVNSLTEVKATSGSGTATTCEVGGNPNVTVKEIVLSELKTTGGGTGTAALSFSVVLPGGTECHYSTPGGTATYNPAETAEGGNVLKISEQTLSVTPLACGSSAKLDGEFSLTKEEGGGAVFLM